MNYEEDWNFIEQIKLDVVYDVITLRGPNTAEKR